MVLNSTLETNVSTSLSNTHTTARSLIKQKLVASVTSLLKTEWLPLVSRKRRNPITVDQAPQAKPHTHPTCPALTTAQASSEEDTRSQEAGASVSPSHPQPCPHCTDPSWTSGLPPTPPVSFLHNCRVSLTSAAD